MFTVSTRTIVMGTIAILFFGVFAVLRPSIVQAAEKQPDQNAKPAAAEDTLVKEYLAAQQLLAQDKFEGVQGHFTKIGEAAKKVGAESQDANIKKQAEEIAKSAALEPKDLKEARKGFKALSSAVIALVQSNPPSADAAAALYEVNCPMAKADWLQTSKDISNPYLGQDMLTCGSVTKTIKPAPAEEKK